MDVLSYRVYHLAGEFARTLKSTHEKDSNVDITKEDILCVEIAGLCHDLGHGPLSHLFDGQFMRKIREEENDATWKHEDTSIEMFEEIRKNNQGAFKKANLDEEDIIFIKELINGPLEETTEDYKYKGRPREKQFLYEIVSNKRNGIDVDKWDYFARDCHMLGIKNNFDHKRYMMFARVIDVKGEGKQICMRDKEASNLYDMFHTRATLHRTAYQHKVTVGIDLMVVDALVKANDHFLIPGKEGQMVKMSESIKDMVAYTKLNDGILQAITVSDKKGLEEAQEILTKLHSRQLYSCIGESIQRIESEEDVPITEGDMQDIQRNIIKSQPEGEELKEDDIEVVLRKFNYGMKDKDPVTCVRFYRKSNPNVAFTMKKEEVSAMLPEKFEERVVTVYAKDSNDRHKHQLIKRCLEKWCEESRRAPRMEKPKIWVRPSPSCR